MRHFVVSWAATIVVTLFIIYAGTYVREAVQATATDATVAILAILAILLVFVLFIALLVAALDED